MKLSNKVYDVLKWVCLIALPAGSVLYSTLAGLWGWAYANEIAGTLAALGTFFGAILGVSTVAYNKGVSNGDA